MAERFDIAAFAYAHRGLWRPDGPPENSPAAFAAAADAGCGIELDVRLTADGVPIIFHDPLLDRMTNGTGLVAATTYADIKALQLNGSDTPPPTLEDTLGAWPAHLPVLVELKTDGAPDTFAAKSAELVSAHAGRAAIMSFDAGAVERVIEAAPSVMRGLLVAPAFMVRDGAVDAMLERSGTLQIDYLAPHISDLGHVRASPHLGDRPLVTWTVDKPDTLAAAKAGADGIIFEHLDPALVRPGTVG
ncbi:MAG: glycerophosphodiester phosphodiesterase family protein [Pseudomonadota bacterium]